MPLARTPYAHGFFRVAACTPGVAPADPRGNLAATLELACAADRQRTGLAVFPELVPVDAQHGLQRAENTVGPYPLQDFFLYYLSRCGYRPSKVTYLAEQAWADAQRGDWRAPSDAGARVWLDELAAVRWP